MATTAPHYSQTNTAPNEPAIPDPDDDVAQLSKDTVFQLVKNWRRREVLRYLNEHNGEANVGELAEHIAAMNEGITVAEVTSKQRKSVYVGLYQCHLPQLDDENVIEYDKNRRKVTAGARLPVLRSYFDDEPEGRLSRKLVGVLLGMTAGATVAAIAMGITSASVLPLVAWGGVSTAGFVVVSMYCLLSTGTGR